MAACSQIRKEIKRFFREESGLMGLQRDCTIQCIQRKRKMSLTRHNQSKSPKRELNSAPREHPSWCNGVGVCWAFPKEQAHLGAYQKARHNNRSWKRRGKFQAREQHPCSLSAPCSAKGWGVQSTPQFGGSRKGKGSQEAKGQSLEVKLPLLKLGGIQTTGDWTQKPTASATVSVTWCLGDIFPPPTDQNRGHVTDAATQPSAAAESSKEPACS